MSQNIVRPDYIHSDGPAAAEPPLSITINSNKPLTNDAISIMASRTPRSYTKIPPPAIQTTLLNIKSHSDSKTSPGSISPPSTSSATSLSPSSASASSPMHQLRRWTSSLSSPGSKTSSPKSTLKVRTIGPISAPQPLTTPVPYACTPLPYSDSPSSPGLMSPLRTEFSTFTVPRSPAKATTLCSDSPVAPPSPTPVASPATTPTFSSVARTSHRTSWKDRIFSSSSIKKENRRASTNSNVDDDYEWSSHHQYNDIKAATAAAAAARAAQKAKPRMRISPPLTHPTLPANQKTVPILSATLSPTDGVYGPDLSELKPVPLSPPSDITAQPAIENACPIKTNLSDLERSASVQLNRPSTLSNSTAPVANGEEAGSFAAKMNSNPQGITAVAPSYFDPKNSNQERNEAHTRCPENENEKPSRTKAPLRIRPSMIKRTSRASSSSYTASSDSSSSSAESESDSDTSDSEQTSPISGASFFSTPPNVASMPSSTALSAALLKSGGIKIPSSLITLASSPKAKATTPSITVTPPTTPPLEVECEPMIRNDCSAPSAVACPPPSCLGSNVSDPRAMTLKRLVHMHTLRKLREREKRSFGHTLLLQLLLRQVQRGVTSQHYHEIGEFYAALSAAQFSPRLDFAHALINAHQQGSLLQQQQEKTIALAKQQEQRWNQEPPAIPLRSTSKGAKVPKAKRSLVSSIQSRIQSSRAFGSSSSVAEEDAVTSLPSSTSSTFYSPTPLSALKDRLPLLRTPSNPLISLEKKLPIAHAPLATPAHGRAFSAASDEPISPPSSDPSDSEDDEDESDESDKDEDSKKTLDSEVSRTVRPTPTVIVPKRTTGRKGVLYQQQLQLQLQMQSLIAHADGQSSMTAIDKAGQEAAAAWFQAQLVGSRPQFATSTYTTICANGSGELITMPLVVASEPPTSLLPQEIAQPPKSNANAKSVRDVNRVENPTASQRPDTVSQGLLTPPLSPLLRSSFPTSQTAVTPSLPAGPQQYWQPRAGAPVHTQSRRYTMGSSVSMPHSTNNSAINHRTSFEGIAAPVAVLGRQRQKSHPAEHQHASKGVTFNSFSLPSPPLSPTIESEDHMANPSRPMVHNRSQPQTCRGSMGRHDNIPLINQIVAQETQMRLYKDDMRSRMRKQQQIQMMKNVKHRRMFSNGNGSNCRVGEESEEDMPLALVQKRISSEALRSFA
ncbi:hypothetical protein BGZ72_002594 [Mortierella alpina]|nr:hypothetical protein BGZ72_002594 [Mortierella alpina]